MRRVFITGGTGNIGARLVKDLVADGHEVMFTSRSKAAGEKLISENQLNTNKCFAVELDFNDEKSLANLKEQLKFLPDVIIHNARSLDSLKISEKGRLSQDQFQQEFFNGITFPVELNHFFIDSGSPLGDIVFISSMYGVVVPNPSLYDNFELQSPINYGVVKASQLHLVKELAVRLASKGIRANAISYGGVEGRVDEEFKKRYSKLTPSGRMLTHNDLYPPVKYILNNPDLNMTGETLKVDGGWTIW